MQNLYNQITFLTGNEEDLNAAPETAVLPMFSDLAVSFLSALSSELMHDRRTRNMPDVLSYAYWIRKSSLVSTKERYSESDRRIGRGIAFHVAPSNVPVNFAVSMTSSLLAGNITVIRVSDKQFEQVTVICDAINRLIVSDFQEMKKYIFIMRYSHSRVITDWLSSICDLRIIWGGDSTIAEIRKSLLPPRAVEMTFPDRHSVAVINSDVYLQNDASVVAKGFYTDTYYTDQNACSSPRLVFWLGRNTEQAQECFWKALSELVHTDYQMKPVQAVDKYSMLCRLGMKQDGVHLQNNDNMMMRISVDDLTSDLMDYKMSGGYFFEYCARGISELLPVLGKRCQTVSVLGVDKNDILSLVIRNGVRGVDRIVPLGETMGLEFVWDGYKMIEAMTRLIYINL